jgi:hypothetical protein
MGYDSIVQSMNGDEIVVFKPEQIKLADGSNTTFDADNPDIRYNDGGVIDEEAQSYIDIISMNPKAPKYDKYKELLKKKFNIDYDSEYANRDEEIIENADLNNLKSKNDFLDYQNYVKYCRKIFQLRGFNKNQPKHIEGIVTLELAERIGEVLGFEVEFKNYNGSGNYAESIGETIRIPQNVDINTFIHEIGHFFDHEFSKEYDGKAKNSVYATSPYFIGKSDEVFAENFMTYFIAPDWLKNNMPVVYYELDEKIPEIYKITINNLIETVNGEIKKEGLRYEQGGLIAPNGKPSNLTQEQYKLVRTPEFKAWFGDWENDSQNASKVVDENGEPLVCYHGTKKDIKVFNDKRPFGDFYGIYFTPNVEYSKKYGSKIIECFLNIRKPIISDKSIGSIIPKYLFDYYKKTNDGIFWSKSNEIQKSKEIICFYSNQIKLANGSNTTFDAENPDIRYGEGGGIQTGTNVTYPQPPADLSAYIRANDYWDAIGKFYFETKDGQPLSSRFQPYLGEFPPVGSWRIDNAKLMDGRFIDYLMEMPIDLLISKELDSAGKLDPTKRGDDERYAEWIKAGFRSIPIEVVQTDKGNFVITDGHRRYLAHKLAGKDTIEAWVSFTLKSPRGTPVGLTYELAHPNNRIPLLETGGAIKEPNDLTFASYEDALHWINHRSKNFDNKNSFYASVEYKQIYPEVVELYKIEQSKHRERAKLAMQQAGIDFGDRVMFDLVNYLQVETFTGTIVNRGGIPYVKLDDGQQTMSGQKSVKWHKGWKKMDNYDKSDE